MQKKTIRTLYLISLAGAVLGAALMVGGLYGGTLAPYTRSHYGSPGNLPLFIAGGVVLGAAGIVLFVAYVLALIKMAQNQQWTWFVLSLILNFFGFFWSIFPSLIWSFFPDVAAPLPAGSPPGNL